MRQIAQTDMTKGSLLSTVRRTLGSDRGIALTVVMFVTALLLTITGSSLFFSGLDLRVSSHHKTGTMAFFATEAGLIHAWTELENGDGVNDFDSVFTAPNGTRIVSNNNFSGAAYTVSREESASNPSRIKLLSVGTAPNNSRSQIEAWFTKGSISPFNSGAFGKRFVNIGGGGRTDSYNSALACPPGSDAGYCVASRGNNGDVASNGNIRLDSGAQVNGDATAHGTVSLDTGSRVAGTITEGAPERALDPVDAAYRVPNSNSSGIRIISDPTGDTLYDPVTHDLKLGTAAKVQLGPGTYYFRSLTLDEAAKLVITGDVVIYLTGVFKTATASQANVDSSPATKFNPPSRMVTYSSCTDATAASLGQPYCVDVDGGSGFSGAVYVPEGNIRTDHGGNVYGSMIGGSVSNDSGTQFHYDEALANVSGSGNEVQMSGWIQRF